MKIYFDGGSITWGADLIDNLNSRFSKLVCDNLKAEEYNIAKRNGGCRRVVRNLIDHDLSKYDLFVIDMPPLTRTEYYGKKKEWITVNYNAMRFAEKNELEIRNYWIDFVKHIYSDKLGQQEQIMHHTIVKGLLYNKPHITLGFDLRISNNVIAPVDIKYTMVNNLKQIMGRLLRVDNNIPRGNRGHPSEEGHKYIADDVIKWCNENLF
tara:strand:+ start:635 stop:1261 length:627 start_codon:yes stop_codon:yes gene_type:complete